MDARPAARRRPGGALNTQPGRDLDRLLAGSPYQGYLYAYPHKTAYRPLERPLPLREVWADEGKGSLFLYLHVPFCEHRCGFCNLFTQTHPRGDLPARVLGVLARQAAATREALGDQARFARVAIGGGTPTYLEAAALERLFDLAEALGARPREVPVSVETSPQTATPERLAVLRDRGASRVSIGVQSFVEAECRAGGRTQPAAEAEAAVARLKAGGFAVVNVDLIYGLPGQTPETWRHTLERALAHDPEELFLYPLYVRPLTGLARRDVEPADDLRLELYRRGRDLLLSRGYRQVSMRLFRAARLAASDGPAYCCQEDGMVGLGPGARSYARGLHYATEYAVGMRGVKEIIAAWAERSRESFAAADYGLRLGEDEQRRRYAIQSLLWESGLVLADYRARFGDDPRVHLPQLADLEPRGLATETGGALRLTAAGLERSDVLGPWLISPAVRGLMAEYELR